MPVGRPVPSARSGLRSGGTAVRSVLCVTRGHEEDHRVIDRASTLALEHGARLTVLHLWAPTPMVYFVGLVGAESGALIAEHEQEAQGRLRSLARELPNDLPCTLVCKRRRFGKDALTEALARHHDCLVASRATLRRRRRAWISRLGSRPLRLYPDARMKPDDPVEVLVVAVATMPRRPAAPQR